MIESLLLSMVAMTVCVGIQGILVSMLLRLLFILERRHFVRPTLVRDWCVMSAALLVMFLSIVAQIAIWAGLFLIQGEFDEFHTAFYHSTVNITTLGYGDIVMSEDRRLLGAMQAVNGVLMFGLTTGVLFAVMHTLMGRAWTSLARTHSEGAAASDSE